MIQEIARAHDQPSVVAEHLIDRAAFGDHPLGRPVLGPEEHLRTFTRDAIVAFRAPPVGRARAAARSWSATSSTCPRTRELAELFGRFPSISGQRRLRAGAGVRADDAGRAARLQPVAPADVLPPVDRPARRRAQRAALTSTRRCSAARWARACSTRSASSAGSPTRSTRSTTRSPTCRSCSSRPGLESAQVRRGLHAHARDRRRAARPTARPRSEVERARAYAAGRRVLAFENTNAVARHAATPDGRLRRRTSTPTRRSPRSTRSPSTRSTRSPAGSPTSSRSPASARTSSDEFSYAA